MASNESCTLCDRYSEFVHGPVESERCSTASDVVRVRLLEAEEAKLESLCAALDESERSGPSRPFNFDGFLAHARSKSV